MEWPQITMIAMMAMGCGISAAKSGEPRPPYSFVASLIGTAITAYLLFAGGFFSTH